MKKLMAALMIAALLLITTALTEEDDFGFMFGEPDEGYTGEWMTLVDLGMDFCLPEGWKEVDAEPGQLFRAVNADQTVGLTIYVESEYVNDVEAWAQANLDAYETDEANLYEALIEEQDALLVIRFIDQESRLVAFRFDRTDKEALTRDFALQIVGSVQEGWFDDEFAFGDEGDGTDFFEDEGAG